MDLLSADAHSGGVGVGVVCMPWQRCGKAVVSKTAAVRSARELSACHVIPQPPEHDVMKFSQACCSVMTEAPTWPRRHPRMCVIPAAQPTEALQPAGAPSDRVQDKI